MEKFVTGDVVAVPFPFSDLSGKKLRPALVLAEAERNGPACDLILCQLTSKPYSSRKAIEISDVDFLDGGLPLTTYIRPDKLFTAEASIIQKYKGKLKPQPLRMALTTVQELFSVD